MLSRKMASRALAVVAMLVAVAPAASKMLPEFHQLPGDDCAQYSTGMPKSAEDGDQCTTCTSATVGSFLKRRNCVFVTYAKGSQGRKDYPTYGCCADPWRIARGAHGTNPLRVKGYQAWCGGNAGCRGHMDQTNLKICFNWGIYKSNGEGFSTQGNLDNVHITRKNMCWKDFVSRDRQDGENKEDKMKRKAAAMEEERDFATVQDEMMEQMSLFEQEGEHALACGKARQIEAIANHRFAWTKDDGKATGVLDQVEQAAKDGIGVPGMTRRTGSLFGAGQIMNPTTMSPVGLLSMAPQIAHRCFKQWLERDMQRTNAIATLLPRMCAQLECVANPSATETINVGQFSVWGGNTEYGILNKIDKCPKKECAGGLVPEASSTIKDGARELFGFCNAKGWSKGRVADIQCWRHSADAFAAAAGSLLDRAYFGKYAEMKAVEEEEEKEKEWMPELKSEKEIQGLMSEARGMVDSCSANKQKTYTISK